MLTVRLPSQRPRRAIVVRAFAAGGALLLLVLLAGCADVDRTVTAREAGGTEGLTVSWESNLYPAQRVEVSEDCWDRAVVSKELPRECLTVGALVGETDSYQRNRLVTIAGSALVIAALLWFAMRRIGWRPVVASRAEATPRHSTGADAVRLMRGANEERQAQRAGDAHARDLRHPALIAALVGVALIIPPIPLFGYGTSLTWAIFTGALLLAGGAVAALVVLIPLPSQPENPEPLISRLLFIGGVSIALIGVSIFGLFFRAPLLELNGIAWPA